MLETRVMKERLAADALSSVRVREREIEMSDVALLTGGSDKHYALGLAEALSGQNLRIDFIGSDELDCADVRAVPGMTFLNLRGDMRENVGFLPKMIRIARYYARLIVYAARGHAPILHILWNNKFEWLDRTLLMLYYRLVGKRVVLTVHNVNMAERDGRDSWLNRASLRIQYRLCDHMFVHTAAMRVQLMKDFGVSDERVSLIPYGLNDTIPTRDLPAADAKRSLGLAPEQKTLLCFGQIAPYKGLEYLVEAVARLANSGENIRLIVAGKIKRGHEAYWSGVQRAIEARGMGELVMQHAHFIPDDKIECYFKAADAVVLPYVSIFQSGIPFIAFNFGVPVIATDVGSLREDIVEETGLLCRPQDPADLAEKISQFFQSDLYRRRELNRTRIRAFGETHHSWARVADCTRSVYSRLAAAPD